MRLAKLAGGTAIYNSGKPLCNRKRAAFLRQAG